MADVSKATVAMNADAKEHEPNGDNGTSILEQPRRDYIYIYIYIERERERERERENQEPALSIKNMHMDPERTYGDRPHQKSWLSITGELFYFSFS